MRHWFELTHFLKLYGHANPSRKQFPTLADWVFQQRQRFRRQRLSLFRKKRLDDIGFEFDRSKAAKQNKLENQSIQQSTSSNVSSSYPPTLVQSKTFIKSFLKRPSRSIAFSCECHRKKKKRCPEDCPERKRSSK